MKQKRQRQSGLIKSQLIYHGSLFDVRRDRVREPGGILATRELVMHCGAVVVLPVLEDGRILLVRQYRHAAGRSLWELVAGRIERGERPAAAAKRELLEETGYEGHRFRRLIEFFPSPGFLTERMTVYLAEGLKAGKARPEADEKIRVGAFRVADLENKIRRGMIRDGKTIAGVLFYRRFIAQKS